MLHLDPDHNAPGADTADPTGSEHARHHHYHVVVNQEEQYSIWPAHRPVPDGWSTVGVAGTRTECLRRLSEIWADIRPVRLRHPGRPHPPRAQLATRGCRMTPRPAEPRTDPGTVQVSPLVAEMLAETAHTLAAAGTRPESLCPHFVAALPGRLWDALAGVLRPPDRTRGRLLVRGLLSGFPDPGPTPLDWRAAVGSRHRAVDLAVALMSASLGEIFAWSGHQRGRLVQNLVPGEEPAELGSRSIAPLTWRVADAYHPRRPELVLQACLRNDDGVGVRVASVRRADLGEAHPMQLTRPLVSILPDTPHPQFYQPNPPRMATLWQAADGWCLRYDPAHSRFHDPDPPFRRAYQALGEALEGCAEEVRLEPGDVLVVDNDVAAHSRVTYRPRHDGTDRWFKQAMIRLPRPRPAAELAEDGYGQALVEPFGCRT